MENNLEDIGAGGDTLGLRGLVRDLLRLAPVRVNHLVKEQVFEQALLRWFDADGGLMWQWLHARPVAVECDSLTGFAGALLSFDSPLPVIYLRGSADGLAGGAMVRGADGAVRDIVTVKVAASRAAKMVHSLGTPKALAAMLDTLTDLGEWCPELLMATMLSIKGTKSLEASGRGGFRNASRDEMGAAVNEVEALPSALDVPIKFRFPLLESLEMSNSAEDVCFADIELFARVKDSNVSFHPVNPDFWSHSGGYVFDRSARQLCVLLGALDGQSRKFVPLLDHRESMSESSVGVRFVNGAMPTVVG